MTVQGLVKDRKHQFGRQAAFNTKVAAVRAYPFKGVPDNNLNWVDEDVDVGSIDPVVPPHREAPELTAPLTTPALKYNNLSLMLSGIFGGGVTPTGGGDAKTWIYEPASETVDDFDVFTYEFGDDVVTDWFQMGDGTLESLEITGPDGLGPLTASMGWRFGSTSSTGSTDDGVDGTVPTASLSPSTTDVIVYLKDGAIFISDDYYSLLSHQVSDALHTFTLRISQPLDLKRWANGDQKFDIDAYGRGPRVIEMECTYSKTFETVGTGSESDAWMSDSAVNRYIGMVFESVAFAEGSTPYSWAFSMPARYYTRTEGEIGGNTVVVLTARAFYDADNFQGVFKSTVVNTLAAGDL
jgi:hypothetical protein